MSEVESQPADPLLGASTPDWANVWHLWRVILPRRSVTGRLVWGKVWRRHDGRHWTYKRFVEFDSRRQ